MQELNLMEASALLFEDNAGSIFMAENNQVSNRRKHIDLKHHFIQELTESVYEDQQGKHFKIESAKKTADIGTNNVENNLFVKHAEDIDNRMSILKA